MVAVLKDEVLLTSAALRGVLDALPHGAALIDGRGQIEWANAAWYAAFPRHGEAARNFLTYLRQRATCGEMQAVRLRDAVADVLAGRRAEAEIVSPSRVPGGQAWHRTRIAPAGADGVRRFLVTQADVTAETALREERRRLADRVRGLSDELNSTKERFRDFTLAASDWFWEMGPSLRFTCFMEQRTDLGGILVEDFIGKTFWDVAGGDPDRDEKWRRHRAIMTTRSSFREFEYDYTDPYGRTLTFRASGKPFFAADGTFSGYRGIITDITERKGMQGALRDAREQADVANRAKSEFLAAMSHDLRTPLNTILGFAEIMDGELFGPVGERYHDYVKDIRASGQMLLSLVNEILDLTAIEAGGRVLHKSAVDVAQLAGDCARIVAATARVRGVDLRVDCAPGGATIHADNLALQKVLLNLLSNAIKYTPNGGRVTLSAAADADGARFVVSDTGKGIPAKDLARLMEPFQRGEYDAYKSKDGWGLGLAIAKSLVDLHDGALTVDSVVERGTVVTVTLPTGSPQPD